MKRLAPARAGALILILLTAAACSSHVDVGFSRDAAAPPRADAGDGGNRTDAGVARAGPPTETVASVRRLPQ